MAQPPPAPPSDPRLSPPSPTACPDTATTALLLWVRESQGCVLNIAQLPGHKGKDSHPPYPLLCAGHLSQGQGVGFQGPQTNRVTSDLTDPSFPRILLLLVSSLSKGLQAAASSSAVLELDQRQSCSLACPRGDLLQTSPLLGQKGYGPSSLGMGSHRRGSQDFVYPKKLFYLLKVLVPDFCQTSKSMIKPRTIRRERSRSPWRRNARDRSKPTS